MENQIADNRVELEVGQWHTREERLSKLFSFSLSSNRAMDKEKLEYYDRIAAKYSGTRNADERFALRALSEERRKLEKQLYPSPLVRLTRRYLVLPLLQLLVRRQKEKQLHFNSQSLHQMVQRTGFTGLSAKIDQHIRQGQQQFSLPVSYYVNEKERLDHQLHFAKDDTGQYRFEGYKTGLHNELKPGENREQYFSMDAGQQINVTEAHNLLKGRSVQKDGKWIQCDFNDKDQNGNHRLKTFQSGYGYNVEQTVKPLPIKELQTESGLMKLTAALKQGQRQAVTFVKDGAEMRYSIEANPQFKTVNIYDEHSKKISLTSVTGTNTAKGLKVANKAHQKQEDKQVKQKGMRISR
jgi:hypothetical protein